MLVWAGNFIGALGMALLVHLSGQYAFGHGAVGAVALGIAATKSALPPVQAFFLGILCNLLVCLAVWLALGARGVADKILAIIPPVSAFVAVGGEHCVADMYLVPLGLLIQWGAPAAFWAELGRTVPAISVGHFLFDLAVVTLGNLAGGTLLVGAACWFIYRRPGRRAGE